MRFNPYYGMRGGAAATGGMAQNAAVALYNDTTGAELLAVLLLMVASGIGEYQQVGSLQGTIGSLVGHGIPVVSGDTPRAGAIYSTTNATVPTTADFTVASLDAAITLPPHYPLAIVQPGWSFVVYNQTAGDSTTVGFYWQIVHPEDIRPPYRCMICDPIPVVSAAQ